MICDFECWGFFSCNSIKLSKILDYIETNNKLPDIHSNSIYKLYSPNPIEDITYNFFNNYSNYNNIKIYDNYKFCSWGNQFNDYSILDFHKLSPIIYKYFNPHSNIIKNKIMIINKYNIQPSNCIGIYIRCTDKHAETKLGNFN